MIDSSKMTYYNGALKQEFLPLPMAGKFLDHGSIVDVLRCCIRMRRMRSQQIRWLETKKKLSSSGRQTPQTEY